MVTEEQIKKIIANSLNLAVDELDNETPLQGGPIESLSYVELLLSLEESYQVVASDKELEQVRLNLFPTSNCYLAWKNLIKLSPRTRN